MLPRAVHSRLALIGLAVVAVAAVIGLVGFRRASSEADAVGRTAGLVAVGLDDQALVVALQHERWQTLRDGDVEGARAATDALVAVRDFDTDTLDGLVAARSPEKSGGYDAVIDRLLDRSGHIDPALLDGEAAARAAVNVDLLHWRQSLIEELEAAMGGATRAELDAVRSVTNDWATTLRLSAAPGQADALEAATGADTLTALRDAIDGAATGERALVATQAWNQAHDATGTIVAEADAQIWDELVAERDAARRDARLVPLIVAGAALVGLLALWWVGRRWPSDSIADPDEVPLDVLVSVDPADQHDGGGHDAGADPDEVFEGGDTPAPVLETIFDDQQPTEPVAHTDSELFEDQPVVPGDNSLVDVIDRASQRCMRPEDVLVDTVADGRVTADVAGSVTATLATLIDAALAHGRRGVGVTLIGASHELGYLIWIVDESAAIDDDRRAELNAALGGCLGDDASELLRRLSAAGARIAEHGIDVELLDGDGDMTLTRVFVPGRHLDDADEPSPDAQPAATGTSSASALPDPLAATTTERLSARLARGVGAPEPSPAPVAAAVPQRAPVASTRPVPPAEAPMPRWPTTELDAGPLDESAAGRELTDEERRAAAARRLVEQYRGGVSAARMDGSDDVVTPPGRRS